jgi:hypothetical protein
LLEKTGFSGAGVALMIRKSLLGLLLAAACAAPAAAEPATLLGVFQNWSAFSTGSGSSLSCYALSEPRATRPSNVKRGPIFLMVSDWPARKVKAEPQIVFGYPTKEDGAASLAVAADKYAFFMRNEAGGDGNGWLKALGDNGRLIEAMTKGVSAVAKGISKRGTNTTDTYSLAGFTDAMAKVHAACNM